MFDIGFSELLMIGVVALIVIGPQRLPKVARTAGHLYGRLQRYVSDVKSDISREMELDELKRVGQQFKESVDSTVTDFKQQTTVVDDYLRDETDNIGNAVISIGESETRPPLSEPPVKQAQDHTKSQQSLPLDEPDQNNSSAFAAVVETARSESAGKTA